MYENRTSPEPIIGSWYHRSNDWEEFEVVAIDEDAGTVEVQFFNSDVTEFSMDEWQSFDLEIIEPPEDWSGALEPVDDSEELEPSSRQSLREGFEEEDVLLFEDQEDRELSALDEI